MRRFLGVGPARNAIFFVLVGLISPMPSHGAGDLTAQELAASADRKREKEILKEIAENSNDGGKVAKLRSELRLLWEDIEVDGKGMYESHMRTLGEQSAQKSPSRLEKLAAERSDTSAVKAEPSGQARGKLKGKMRGAVGLAVTAGTFVTNAVMSKVSQAAEKDQPSHLKDVKCENSSLKFTAALSPKTGLSAEKVYSEVSLVESRPTSLIVKDLTSGEKHEYDISDGEIKGVKVTRFTGSGAEEYTKSIGPKDIQDHLTRKGIKLHDRTAFLATSKEIADTFLAERNRNTIKSACPQISFSAPSKNQELPADRQAAKNAVN